MAKSIACPDAQTLVSLVLGRLPDPKADELSDHLEHCARCASALRTLKAEDTLVEAARGADTLDGAGDSEAVRRLMDRLHQLAPLAAAASAPDALISCSCPGCGKSLRVRAALAGKKVKCPGCGKPVPVPGSVPGSPITAEKSVAATLPGRSAPTQSPQQDTQAYHAAEAPEGGEQDFLSLLTPPQSAGELGRLGDYRVLRVLGRGGMGVVFQAEDVALKRTVALKAMLPSVAANKSAAERFRREAQAMAALEHDHIVRIYQVGQIGNTPYLAMEFLKGEPLDERLRRLGADVQAGVVPLAEVLQIGREIALALAFAHESGLIHRDIKPGNIWLEQRGAGKESRVKILDFGLARAASGEANLTQSGAIVGTPAYMAPEQGLGKLDARCDLFSLGVVLYVLATGQQPFRGADTMSTLMAIATHDPPPPAQVNPKTPGPLSDLIMNLLAKDPDHRVQSAQEVADLLKEMEASPDRARPLGKKAVPATRNATHSAPARRRRGPLVAAGVLFLASLVAVAGIVLFWPTPQGVVRIEINDDETTVQIDKNGVDLLKKGSKELRLEPGQYGFLVRREGDAKNGEFQFHTDKLILARGDTVTVRVEITKDKLRLLKDGKLWHETDVAKTKTVPPTPAAGDNFALYFDGKDSRVVVPTLKYDGSHPITIEARVRMERSGAERSHHAIAGWYGVFALYGADFTPGRFFSARAFDQSGALFKSDFIVNQSHDQIVHLAAVYDGATLRSFVDGVAGPSTPCPKIRNVFLTPGVPTDHFAIGCFIGMGPTRAPEQFHKGTIDEVRISKTARYGKNFAPKDRLEADPDTMALYHFDEGKGDVLNDSSGHDHHGKIISAKWVKSDGSPISPPTDDYAIELNGGDNLVTLPGIAVPPQSAFTWEAWVNPKDRSNMSLTALPNSDGMGLYRVALKNNGPQAMVVVAGKNAIGLSRSNSLPASGPFHLAACFSGNKWSLWANGSKIHEGVIHYGWVYEVKKTFTARIGADSGFAIHPDNKHEPFQGTLDEIRISKSMRYTTDFTPERRFRSDKDTIALYHCDEGKGDVLTDSSGHDYHGKIIGAKWVKSDPSPLKSEPVLVAVPEPPPLAEWLKGRTLVTVAQDGKAQFKTIQAALDALKPGQVIKVLDRGPYREALVLKNLPDNIGLVSDQQTTIELPDWTITPNGTFDFRIGHQLGPGNGLRISGFSFVAKSDGTPNPHDMLRLFRTSGVVLEDCRLEFTDSDRRPYYSISAVGFHGFGNDVIQACVVRDCVIENGGIAVTCFTKVIAAPVLCTRNLIRPWPKSHGIFIQGWLRKATLRNNVIVAAPPTQAIHFMINKEANGLDSIDISENTVVGAGLNLFQLFTPPTAVTIERNVLSAFRLTGGAEANREVAEKWRVAGNRYHFRPDPLADAVFRRPDDPTEETRFLSEDPGDRDFARIPADRNLASAGALAPGPAPKDGDWFTRLRDRWARSKYRSPTAPPVQMPEPPPLAEWLKGRTILTVSQDGKAQFKTIQAALEALQEGQAVKVLDKGPYRERLEIQTMPKDTGLFSEVQTVLELPEWKFAWQEKNEATGKSFDVHTGHWMRGPNGFRLHGLEMRFPKADGQHARRFLTSLTRSIVLENCLFRASGAIDDYVELSDRDQRANDGVGMTACVRDCVFEGTLTASAHHQNAPPSPERLSNIHVHHNYFKGSSLSHVIIAGTSLERVVLQHNVCAGKSRDDIILLGVDATTAVELSNNTLMSTSAILVTKSVPSGPVTIRNNICCGQRLVRFASNVDQELMSGVDRWNLTHNSFPDPPQPNEKALSRPPGNPSATPLFLSKAPQEADYLRMAADDPLAAAGAGGLWPSYLGALPPGPAPKTGDWFTRLRERWERGK